MISRKARIRIPQRIKFTENQFEEAWETLKKAFDCIHRFEFSELSYERLYRLIYELVFNKYGSKLYAKFEDYERRRFELIRNQKFSSSLSSDGIVSAICECWIDNCKQFKIISDLMIYMDKVYCKESRVLEIYDLCLAAFKDYLLKPLNTQLIPVIIEQVNQLRFSREINSKIIDYWKTLLSMMETLQENNDSFYAIYFETNFLEATEVFYNTLMRGITLKPIDCLNRVHELKEFEIYLAKQFLNSDTIAKLSSKIDATLLGTQFDPYLAKLIAIGIDKSDANLLTRIFDLSTDEKFQSKFWAEVKDYLQNALKDLPPVKPSKKRSQVACRWSVMILSAFDHYGKLFKECDFYHTKSEKSYSRDISKHSMTENLLNDLIADLLNTTGKQSVEYIALYLDMNLKLTIDKAQIAVAKEKIENCVKLFKLLSERDIFEQYCQQLLSKRLLQQRSSVECERWLVNRLKDELGTLFTNKLEGMLRDINTSATLTNAFKASEQSVGYVGNPNFEAKVLTVTSWPFQNPEIIDAVIKLPKYMEDIRSGFTDFYRNKYNERILKWSCHLEIVEIGHQFAKSYHEISMSVPAASILLLFEEHEKLSIPLIQDLTGLTDSDMKRELLSMTIPPKTRVLLKSPEGRNIGIDDVFTINENFTSNSTKLRIQTIISSNTSTASTVDLKDNVIDESRLPLVNSTLIRSLKGSEELDYKCLYDQAKMELLERFELKHALFKQSLVNLIDKEFIKETVNGKYEYIP